MWVRNRDTCGLSRLVLTRTLADVTMELTPYKFIEKINAGEHERNRRHNGNNNDNNTDSKRCTIS
jgi:hypothetical protein